jgi:hypothetical protein
LAALYPVAWAFAKLASVAQTASVLKKCMVENWTVPSAREN